MDNKQEQKFEIYLFDKNYPNFYYVFYKKEKDRFTFKLKDQFSNIQNNSHSLTNMIESDFYSF